MLFFQDLINKNHCLFSNKNAEASNKECLQVLDKLERKYMLQNVAAFYGQDGPSFFCNAIKMIEHKSSWRSKG